ncbi:MAG: hypothetical protein ACFE9N_01655 [Promethearchaeota archaeon]
MKTGLVRAYLFSLITFFILNFLITIISYSIVGLLIDLELPRYSTHPVFVFFRLIYPMLFFPWDLLILGANQALIGFMVFYFGFFISLIVASVVAGLMGGDIVKSVGGWILTSITCILVFIIIALIDSIVLAFVCFSCTFEEVMVQVIIHGLINILLFGVLTAFIAMLKGRSS